MPDSELILFYVPVNPAIYDLSSTHRQGGHHQGPRQVVGFFQETGKKVKLVSNFSSHDPNGDKLFQLTKINEASIIQNKIASELGGIKVGKWITYHNSIKAPDLLGPEICARLSIPYLVIDASLDAKEEKGKWSLYYPLAAKALQQAKSIISTNPKDASFLNASGYLGKNKLVTMPLTAYFAKSFDKAESRKILAKKHNLHSDLPWLLTIAQFQENKKLESFQYLRDALLFLKNESFEFLIIGSNETQNHTKTFLGAFPQIRFLSNTLFSCLPLYYAASDLFCWPDTCPLMKTLYTDIQDMGLKILMNKAGAESLLISGNKTTFVAHSPKNFAEIIQREIEHASHNKNLTALSD